MDNGRRVLQTAGRSPAVRLAWRAVRRHMPCRQHKATCVGFLGRHRPTNFVLEQEGAQHARRASCEQSTAGSSSGEQPVEHNEILQRTVWNGGQHPAQVRKNWHLFTSCGLQALLACLPVGHPARCNAASQRSLIALHACAQTFLALAALLIWRPWPPVGCGAPAFPCSRLPPRRP